MSRPGMNRSEFGVGAMRVMGSSTRNWLRGLGLAALAFAHGVAAQVTFPLNGNGNMGLGDPNGSFFVVQDDLQVKVPGGYARINRDYDGRQWVFNRQISGLGTPDYNRASYPTIGSYMSCTIIDGVSTCDTTASAGMTVSLPPPPEEITETRVPTDPNFGRDHDGNPLADLTSLEFIARKGIVFTRNTDRTAYTSAEHPRFIVRPQPVKALPPSSGPNAHPGSGKPGQGGISVATVDGFRWTDRSGNWIEYDGFGRAVSYGDRNDVRVWMQYSSTHHRLERILDDNGRTVFTLLYTGNGKFITEARDHTGPTLRRVQYGYDGGGRLTSVTDARGNPSYFTYGSGSTFAKIKSVKDAEGRLTQVGYGTTARMESLIAPDGGTYNFEYSYDKLKKEFGVTIKHPQTAAGRKIESRRYDLEGRTVYREVNGKVLMTASGDRRTISYTDERGSVLTISRNNFDDVTRKNYPDGTSEGVTYESTSSDVRSHVDEAGITTQMTYDGHGNLVKVQAAVGRPEQQDTTYGVNDRGEPEVVRRLGGVLADGSVDPDVEFGLSYDVHGNMEQLLDGDRKVWTFDHDSMGNLTRVVDPLNHAWSYTYDEHGNRLTATDPNEQTSRFTYDKSDRLKTITDPRDKTYTIGYDAVGRSHSVVDPTGAKVVQTFDKAGRIVTVDDTLNQRIELAYDNHDRLTSIIDGEANTTTISYADLDGMDRGSELASKVSYPSFQSLMRYNSRQGLTQVAEAVDSTSRTSTASYDPRGAMTSFTNAYGKTRSAQFDAFGRLTRGEDELGHEVELTYNHRDLLVSVTDHLSQTTRFEFDKRGNPIRETNALGQASNFVYDDAGRLAELHRASGVKVVFTYDPAGRLTRRQSFRPSGAAEHDDGFTWDDASRLTNWSTLSASATLTYDDANRLLTESITQTGVQLNRSYSYHPNGQLRSFTGPDGVQLTYAYDGNGNFARVDIPGQGAVSITERKWVAPQKVLFPGGTVEEFERNGLLLPTRIRVKGPGQVELFGAQMQYGLVDEVSSRTMDGQLTELTYDDAIRLREAEHEGNGTEAFELDPVGNRLSDDRVDGPWTYDAANRLLQRGQVTYAYDADGNLVRKVDASLDEPLRTTRFTYDGYNQLIEVLDGSEVAIARYAYDAFGYRTSKEITSAGSSRSGLPAGRTTYLQGSEGLLAELDPSGQVIRSYGWEPGRPYGTAAIFQRSGGEYFYYHNDHLGTPWQVTNSAGQVVWLASGYSAFGTVEISAGSGLFQPWRLPGQYFDAETGLHYNLRRYYDPEVGRYVSSDPIGLAGGLNLYAYVNGDPVNLMDPRGLTYGNGEWEFEDLIFGPTYWAREKVFGDASVSQEVVDFTAGMGDTLSFGLTDKIRDWMGTNDHVNQCSGWYTAGEVTGTAVSLTFGGMGAGRHIAANGWKSMVAETRTFKTVSRRWHREWKSTEQLDHMFFAQKTGFGKWINSGLNLVPLSPKVNQLLLNPKNYFWTKSNPGLIFVPYVARFAAQTGVLGLYGGVPTVIARNAGECECE
jgi:RHS repeat-associated protein